MIAYFCVEDPLSRVILVRLLSELANAPQLTELQPNQGGFSEMRKKFRNYCTLAQQYHVFVLTDLDRANCPPILRRSWMESSGLEEPLPHKMSFNVAVAEVEAWLLADHKNFSSYLGVPIQAFPNDTQISDPKEFLLHCVRRHGNREARAELLPRGAARVGIGYNAHLSRFVNEQWNFNDAAQRNASLRRIVARIAAAQ